MPTRPLAYAVPATLLRSAVLRVPEDFASIGAALTYLRGKTCLTTAIDIAPGTYNESLIISDIGTGSSFNVANLSPAATPTVGVLGVHSLELRARNYVDEMVPPVIIQGLVNCARDVGVYGFQATLNALPSHLLYGFASIDGGTLSCYDCQVNGTGYNIDGNYGLGFAALNNAFLRVKKAIATNLQNGLFAQFSGLIHSDNAALQNNRGYQVYAAQTSVISVNNMVARGTNGVYSSGNSNIWTTNSTLTGTALGTGIGLIAINGGYINGQGTQASFFNQGFYAATNGKFDANNAIAISCSFGFYPNTGSYMTANASTARNCTTGYYANMGSFLYAPNTLAKASGNGTNYSPSPSGTVGNNNSALYFT